MMKSSTAKRLGKQEDTSRAKGWLLPGPEFGMMGSCPEYINILQF